MAELILKPKVRDVGVWVCVGVVCGGVYLQRNFHEITLHRSYSILVGGWGDPMKLADPLPYHIPSDMQKVA